MDGRRFFEDEQDEQEMPVGNRHPAFPNKLNLVLCGSSAAAKASAADLILGEKTQPSPQPSSVCVKREAEVCGRYVTLVLLPALGKTQLSEEDTMQKILECVLLCDPGVHAFLLVIQQGLLTKDDKEEIWRVQSLFGEGVGSYCLMVFTGEADDFVNVVRSMKETQDTINIPEGCHHTLGDESKVPQLLEKVGKMREENASSCYTPAMIANAQFRARLRLQEELTKMKMILQTHQLDSRNIQPTIQDGLRIVLLGRTGNGKSASGNTILGGHRFQELASANSVTFECQKGTAIVNGRQITVVDTPGFFETTCDIEDTKKEIIRCIAMAAPGPHVFLLVIPVGRFTKEERDAVKMIQQIFGKEAEKYTLVLFTKGDNLQEQTWDKYLEDADSGIKTLIRQCGGSYHVLNNRDKSSKNQVLELLDKIDAMLRGNGGSYYTTETFQRAEEALKQEQERILKEREEEIMKEKEELLAKHEAEMEKLKKEMKEERRKEEEERRKREEEFRFKETDMMKTIKNLEEEEKRKQSEMKEMYKAQKTQNEEWIKQRTAEIQQERQRQHEEWERRTQAEKQRREEEEKQRKLKEMEYERQWHEKQSQEMEKFNHEKDSMMKAAEKEKRKKQQEFERRAKQEKKKIKELEEKIKHAEESKVEELEKQKMKHEEECKIIHKNEEERREEEKEHLRKQIELLQNEWLTKQELQRQEKERHEREKREAEKERDVEEKKKRQEVEDERRKIEQNANRKLKEKDDEMRQLQQEYQSQLMEEQRRSRERQAQQREEVEALRKQFEAEKRREARKCKEREKELEKFLNERHAREKELLKLDTELAARRQAETEFDEELSRRIQRAKAQGHSEGHSDGFEEGMKAGQAKAYLRGINDARSERSNLATFIDTIVNVLPSVADVYTAIRNISS